MRDHVIFEMEHEGRHYRLVVDEEYTVDRPCAYPGRECRCSDEPLASLIDGKQLTEKEACEFYYQQEIQKLREYDWVALGCLVTRPCGGLKTSDTGTLLGHCECCSNSKEDGALWGIVLENSEGAFRRWVVEEGIEA